MSTIRRVVYHNRSPVALPTLVLNLYQNVFAPGSPRNRATSADGRRASAEIPVERWLDGGRTAVVTLPVSGVGRVEIDPERHFPDVDRSNDVWTAR